MRLDSGDPLRNHPFTSVTQPMNPPNTSGLHSYARVGRATAAALSLLGTHLAFAQSTAPADDEKDQAIVLSPFVVDASEDVGYRATSTLAGSRIKTDLRDVAAPLTVVTKEFLNDVNAVDINDIL